MLQPRSFLFTRQNSSSAPEVKHERPAKERTAPRKLETSKQMPSRASEDASRPITPSSPVVIPLRNPHVAIYYEKPRVQGRKTRHDGRKQSPQADCRSRPTGSQDDIPPAVAALLALTAIPRQKTRSARYRSGAGQRLTEDAMLRHMDVSEKDYRLNLARSPLDLLLSPPEDEDDMIGSENGHESLFSRRTMSSDSIPSLDDDSINDTSPSPHSILTPGSGRSCRSKTAMRRQRIRSVSSTRESTLEDHPLLVPYINIEELDFRVFEVAQHKDGPKLDIEIDPPRRKSAFKSNLTASLKALRAAARSFSTLTTPMITPDDFLTRSIISIDPQVPFTDERMPPRLEDTPTPALRRYLNPTTNAPIEAHVRSSLAQTTPTQCTASIQMQTYKISRSAKSTSPSVISRRTQPTSEESFADVAAGPVARQRDMRENSDFIRVAVMEMLMRKKGKLDDQKPGRARWALPPRKPPTKTYEISDNGVPVRWIAVTD